MVICMAMEEYKAVDNMIDKEHIQYTAESEALWETTHNAFREGCTSS